MCGCTFFILSLSLSLLADEARTRTAVAAIEAALARNQAGGEYDASLADPAAVVGRAATPASPGPLVRLAQLDGMAVGVEERKSS
jgi:hypothetical protein